MPLFLSSSKNPLDDLRLAAFGIAQNRNVVVSLLRRYPVDFSRILIAYQDLQGALTRSLTCASSLISFGSGFAPFFEVLKD